jgi:hypothetical protein
MSSFKTPLAASLAASLVRNSRKEQAQDWQQSIALAAQSEDNFEREVEVRTRAICEYDFCASFTSLVESEVHSALLAHVKELSICAACAEYESRHCSDCRGYGFTSWESRSTRAMLAADKSDIRAELESRLYE